MSDQPNGNPEIQLITQEITALFEEFKKTQTETFQRLLAHIQHILRAESSHIGDFSRFTARFYGNPGESVDVFINVLEAYMEALNISKEDGLRELDVLLRGRAAVWWARVRHLSKTWRAAMAGLRLSFGEIRRPFGLYREIFAREQMPDERTDVFIARLRILFAKVPAGELQEKTQLDMVFGLLHRKIRNNLCRDNIRNFSDLLNQAREVEHVLKEIEEEINVQIESAIAAGLDIGLVGRSADGGVARPPAPGQPAHPPAGSSAGPSADPPTRPPVGQHAGAPAGSPATGVLRDAGAYSNAGRPPAPTGRPDTSPSTVASSNVQSDTRPATCPSNGNYPAASTARVAAVPPTGPSTYPPATAPAGPTAGSSVGPEAYNPVGSNARPHFGSPSGATPAYSPAAPTAGPHAGPAFGPAVAAAMMPFVPPIMVYPGFPMAPRLHYGTPILPQNMAYLARMRATPAAPPRMYMQQQVPAAPQVNPEEDDPPIQCTYCKAFGHIYPLCEDLPYCYTCGTPGVQRESCMRCRKYYGRCTPNVRALYHLLFPADFKNLPYDVLPSWYDEAEPAPENGNDEDEENSDEEQDEN